MVAKLDTEDQGAPFDVAADWLSFSLKRPVGQTEAANAESVYNHIKNQYPELQIIDLLSEQARSPYRASFKLAIGGMVMFSNTQNHALVEIEGAGCRHLEDAGLFYPLATRVITQAMNITRFDIAVDFETDTDPEAFALARGERFKASGVMESETGKTAYVGAPKSNRRARVYRYSEPHPRAHLLRVEMVIKKPRAGDALSEYLKHGALEYAAMCGNAFGWCHPLWSFKSDAKIKSWTPERGAAGSQRWLHNAVLPAIERMTKSGILYPEHPFWTALVRLIPESVLQPDKDPPSAYRGVETPNPHQQNLFNTDTDVQDGGDE